MISLTKYIRRFMNQLVKSVTAKAVAAVAKTIALDYKV